jgi:hypothetical protein
MGVVLYLAGYLVGGLGLIALGVPVARRGVLPGALRVVPVGLGVLPRTEGKARRVTDLRGSAPR